MAIAYLLKLPPSRVPLFVAHRNWRERVNRFFYRRGLDLAIVDFHPKFLKNKRKLYLVQGESPRNPGYSKGNWDHMVVYKGKKPHYDPDKSNDFVLKPTFVWLLTKVQNAEI